MATLTPTLTLTSTDATIDQLSFSVTDSLSVTAPIQSMSKTIVVSNVGGNNIVVPPTGGTVTYFTFLPSCRRRRDSIPSYNSN